MPKNIVVYSGRHGPGRRRPSGAAHQQHLQDVPHLAGPRRHRIDPSHQVVFYDAGLGTDIGATALTAPVRFVQKLLGSVTGAGIKRNIADCYEFIINHYEEGDRIFLFGFSRGAYTVRSLANLLMLCGVPTKTPAGPLMRFRKAVKDIAWEAVDTVLEHGAGHPRAEFEAERLELARRFQVKYGSGDGSRIPTSRRTSSACSTPSRRWAPEALRYLVIQAGLAAGVAAAAFVAGFVPAVLIAALSTWSFGTGFMLVRLPRPDRHHRRRTRRLLVLAEQVDDQDNRRLSRSPGQSRSHQAVWKGENFDRLLSRHVALRAVRQRDRRDPEGFRPGRLGRRRRGRAALSRHDRLRPVWFAGNHSDIGGSYPEPESRLSDIALEWMCEQGDLRSRRPEDGSDLRRRSEDADGRATPVRRSTSIPTADGVQHCEVAGMRDTLDGYRR